MICQTDNLISQIDSLTISPIVNLITSQIDDLIINPIGKIKINLISKIRTNRTDNFRSSQIQGNSIVSQIIDKQMHNFSQTSIIILGDNLISLTPFYSQDVEDRITLAQTVKHINI